MNAETPAQPGLRIEYLPLSKIKRFDRNPKKHDVGALVTSIQRYGFRDAPIFDGTLGALVAGHGRLKALDELRKQKGEAPRGIQTGDNGEWLVPVQLGVDAASAVEAQAFLVDHNALTVAGGDMGVEGILRLYDQDGLGAMLKEMAEAGEMPVTLDGDDLDALLGAEKPALDAEPQIDRAAELQKKWGTARGQLWALGDHRLLCGDSTSREDVAAVMGGEQADCVFTDPPYGVDYVAMRGGKKIANDYTPANAHATMAGALALVNPNVAFVCCSWRSLPITVDAMVDVGLIPKACIVWDKERRVQNLDRYFKQHEFVLYAGPYGGEPTVDGDLWRIPRDFDPDHPTPKPVELPARALRTASAPGASVFDPFLGSGTTLIAAENLNRRCYGIEISPEYVAVTLQRWADATGKTPELLP